MGSTVSPTQAAAEQVFASDERLGSEAQPDSSDANNARGPAWNRRPINGDTGSIMGGAMPWPSLSESTRPVIRSSSDSSRPVSDGSATSSQALLISQSSQIQAAHSNSSTNNSSRPRSRTRGGGSFGSGPPQNTFQRSSPPALPPFPGFDAPNQQSSPMAYTQRPGVGSSQRNAPSRRGNYGPRPRGGGVGPNQNNYGGSRRHQDRRDAIIPQQYMPPLFMGHMPPPPLPPGVPPFMTQPPFTVYPGQMGFEMASAFMYVPPVMPPEPFRAMPIVPPPPPPMFSPLTNENTLTNKIVSQIDYYFSDDNLAKDHYLRSMMDDNGWVPVRLIASFRRVEQLSKDFRVILDALRHSTILELQDEKIRRRATWKKWVSS